MRKASVARKTKGNRDSVSTRSRSTAPAGRRSRPASAFSTMLDSSRASLIDLKVKGQGRSHIDFHHTTEDTGIAIGEAVSEPWATARHQPLWRCVIPMDETLTRVALDASNRPYLIWKVDLHRPESWATWIPSCSRNGSRPSRRRD